MCHEPGIIRKVIWLLVVLTCYGLATWNAHEAINQYMKSTTVTTMNSTTASLKDIYFPGITLCNVNQVSKTFLHSINAQNNKDSAVLFNEFLDGNPKLWKKYLKTGIEDPIYGENRELLDTFKSEMKKMYNWDSTQSFVKMAHQVCHQMLPLFLPFLLMKNFRTVVI